MLVTLEDKIECPHCHNIMDMGKDIRVKDLFNPVPGESELVNREGTKNLELLLPSHLGISAARLVESRVAARQGPLAELYAKYTGIHNSSANSGKRTYVWGAGSADTARVLVIGEAPGPEEDKFSIPFIGPAGQCFSAVLHTAGISRADDILLVNSTNYMPIGTGGKTFGKPTTKELWENRDRIIKIIKALQTRKVPLKAVVCLGKYALAQLRMPDRLLYAFKDNKEINWDSIKISQMRGWVEDKVLGVKILQEFHPSYIWRRTQGLEHPMNDTEIASYLESFKTLKKVIDE